MWRQQRHRDRWTEEETNSAPDLAEERVSGESVADPLLHHSSSHLPPFSPSPFLSPALTSARACVGVCATPVCTDSAAVRRCHRGAGKRRRSRCLWEEEIRWSLDLLARLTSSSEHQQGSLSRSHAHTHSLCLSLSLPHTHNHTLRLTHSRRLDGSSLGWTQEVLWLICIWKAWEIQSNLRVRVHACMDEWAPSSVTVCLCVFCWI